MPVERNVVLFHLAADIAEVGLELGAHCGQSANYGNGNEGGNQAIFNRRCS